MHQALRMLVDCYNHYHKEIEFPGKKYDQNIYIESLYHFKTLLKSDEKHKKAFQLFEDIENVLKY